MEELDTHSPLSPNTVIKHEVADNVSLQANQPKAMSLGIDRQKAFDEKDSDSRDNDRQLISHVEHRVGPPDRTIKPNMESHEQEIEDEASPPSDAAIEVASTPSSAAAPPSKKRKSKKKSKTQVRRPSRKGSWEVLIVKSRDKLQDLRSTMSILH